MAVEAMSQMNSDSVASTDVHGYTLRNANISMALVVPDDDEGVETLFSLRPSNSQSTIQIMVSLINGTLSLSRHTLMGLGGTTPKEQLESTCEGGVSSSAAYYHG
jgi:Polyketide synthase dehydratase